MSRQSFSSARCWTLRSVSLPLAAAIFACCWAVAGSWLLPIGVAQAETPRSQDSSQSAAVPPAPPIPNVKIEAALQEVEVDGIRFGFEADVTVCLDRKSRGFGFVEFTSGDGDVLRLVPVWGTVDWETRAVVLVFTPVVDREIEPEDLVVAVVQQSTSDPGCLAWDYVGDSTGGNTLPPPFDAEGTISLSRRGGECEPADYGQLDAWVAIDTPLQEVEPLPHSNIVGFEARIGLNRNQAARGFLDVQLPGETVSYEPIYGAAFPGNEESSSVSSLVVLLQGDRLAPLNTNHLLRATVAVDAADPDCLIWEFTGTENEAVNGTFEALGEIRVWSPRATAAEIRLEPLNNKYPENP